MKRNTGRHAIRVARGGLRRIAISVLLAASIAASGVRADTVVIPVAEDTAPYSFLPNLPRYNNPTLYAFSTEDESGTPHDFETYLWFDVSAEDVPEGQVLTQALLAVTYGFDFTAFGPTSSEIGRLDCREVLAPWDQTTLSWTNRPAADEPFDSLDGIVSFGSLICDATPVVRAWLLGLRPNEGIVLSSPSERVMGMYSSEAAVDATLRPTLFLLTEVPEPSPTLSLGLGALGLARLARRRRRDASGNEHAR